MAKIILAKAGESATLHIAKCEVVESAKGYGEQVKFTAPNGDELYVGRSSADGQLGRNCGFGEKNPDGKSWNIHYDEVDGCTLMFYRDENPKAPDKPYWGIKKVLGGWLAPARGTTEDDVPPPSDDDYPGDGWLGELPNDPPRRAQAPAKATPAAPAKSPAQRAVSGAEADMQALKDKQAAALKLAERRQEIVEVYRFAYAASIDVQGEVEAATIQAGAATILIALQKAGVA